MDRDVHLDAPDRPRVADITGVPTRTGFVFLAVVADAVSRRVVGWATGGDLGQLVLDALSMALGQRRPRDVVHRSDQGSQGGLDRSSQRRRPERR